MKKILLILLMITAGAVVFATGVQEANEDGVVTLEKGQLARNSELADLEKVKLTGTLLFESPIPELRVGNREYTLMAPGAMSFTGYIEEGEKISVSAYVIDPDAEDCPVGVFGRGPGMGAGMVDVEALDGNTLLLVESVTVDGTEYQLPWVEEGFGRRGGAGGRSGMMNNSPGARMGGNPGAGSRRF